VYIPTFLEFQQNNFQLSLSALQSKYYVFALSSDVKVGRKSVDELLRETSQRMNLLFSNEKITLERMKGEGVGQLEVACTSGGGTALALNTVHSEEEIGRIINRGRQFKKFEVENMSHNAVWKLDRSSLENSSFQSLPEMNNVIEIQAKHNNISSLRFITSSSLRILDLSNNKVSELTLTENDLPNLERLTVDNNSLRTVKSLRHNSLRTLSLAHN